MQQETYQRSIGHKELDLLLKGILIEGQYNLELERQSTGNIKKAVCFFETNTETKPFEWRDKNHIHTVTIKPPHLKKGKHFQKGIGTYYVSKNTLDLGVWAGRKGSNKIKLNEAYFNNYSIYDIVELKINIKQFTQLELELWAIPQLLGYGFKIEKPQYGHDGETLIATKLDKHRY